MHDVVVIGAGPGGSATAHYLARAGFDVLLLDKADFPRDKTCGDGLTPRAVSVLQDMGLVEALARVGHVIKRFEVVAPNRRSTADAITVSSGLPDFSLVVPRFILDDHIRQRAVHSGARFEPAVRVNDIRIERSNGATHVGATHVEVKATRAGRSLTFAARMAVIATGAHTGLLVRAGILKHPPKVMVASRAYFEAVRGLTDAWTLRFDNVPIPGYGWIFPTAPDTANIGVGYFKANRATSATGPFRAFVQSPALRAVLGEARQVGPAKGFPLRDDFLTAPTWSERVLLVGEAAGLVNPLTGEGIDYALESGRLAAAQLCAMFERADFSPSAHQAYDRALREHFQPLFEFCVKVRELCMRPFVLNALVMMANHRRDLRARLVSVVLGGAPVRGKLTIGRVMRALIQTG